MISRLASLLLTSCIVLGVTACSGGGTSIPECQDGVDNDGDGLLDDTDPACIAGADREADDPPVACNDTIDNDGDGRIDFGDDPGCDSEFDTDEFNVRIPACMDGVDNDGDTKIDFPNDPGCFTGNQDDEQDDCPSGANCPECSDGADNDFDGQIDYPADTGCASASGVTEFVRDANACGTGTTIIDLPANGQAVGSALATGPSNVASTTCNGRGAETAYLFTVPHPVTMVASTNSGGTTLNTVLYVRRNCLQAATEVACNDDISPTNNKSSLTANLPAGSYYLIVDARDLAGAGQYQLSVLFYEGLGQACVGPANCAPGYTCRAVAPATTTTCELPVCSDSRDDDGDGKIDFPLDPGCTDAADATEDDTCPGAGCPQCGDGVDNDLDGATDYPMDSSCASAAAASEANCPGELDPLLPITGPTVTGTTVGAGNNLTATCGSASATAPDRVHFLDLRVALATLDIAITPSFDSAISLRDATCGTTYFCNDANTIARTNVAAGGYGIVVDGWSSGSGTYTLTVRGTIAVGSACNDPLVAAGVLSCATGSACAGAPGLEVCTPAACNDAMDADGDGFNGYPTDPGCTAVNDNDETDDCPTGPMCPQCGNQVDDDGDGLSDYPMDFGCVSASGANEECASIDPIIPFTGNVIGASTVGHANDVDLSCGLDGRDDVYRLRLLAPLSELRVNTSGSALDTILAIKRGGCASFDLQCDDDLAGAGDSSVFLIDVPAGDYFLVVDDKNVASPGTYNLNVAGLYADGAACDPASTIFRCNPGLACAGATPTCVLAACNDAIDADADGFNGYPTDPGCTGTSDNDETDDCPTGPGCPVCSDDVDNDVDGFIDYPMDPSCTSAAADSEFAPCVSIDPVLVFSQNLTGATTNGDVNDVDLSCGVDGRDDIYRVFVTQPLVSLSADTDGSPMATAVALRSATCNGTTDLNCGVNNFGTGDARATISAVAVGEYFVIVDDLNTAGPSTYNLRVTGLIAAGDVCNPASTSFICIPGYACAGTAGAETCVVAACNDAVDADGDTFPGYPSDPGCATSSDNDEADNCPSGPGCPACADGLDNDADTRIDYPLDLGCNAASTTSEAECQVELDPIIAVTGPATPGTTVGASNSLVPTCGSASHNAPERVHILNVRVPLATLHVDTNPTGFDNVLTLSDATCGPTIACVDSPIINRTNVAPGAYTVIVDGWSTGAGAYTLNVSGTIADNGACNDPLVAAGVFTCNPGFACTGPVGTETCTPAACNDAIDADGDGFPGYPTDPGCTSTSDGDETDACPSGPGCPVCSDDLDNDTDGFIDYPLDLGCGSASGVTELGCPAETDPILVVAATVTTSTTVGATDNFTPSCAGASLDRVHILSLAVPVASLTMDTENSTGLTDTVMMFMTATCGLPPIACDDDTGTGFLSSITRTNVAAGTYAIEVDSYGTTNPGGAYTLNVRGTIAAGGSCNDPLVAAGVLTCAAGTTCQANVCSP